MNERTGYVDANAFFTMMNEEYIVEKVEGIIHVSGINPRLKMCPRCNVTWAPLKPDGCW